LFLSIRRAIIQIVVILSNILLFWLIPYAKEIIGFYFVFFDPDIPMKLVRLIKICLTEMYKRIQVAKYLPHIFSLRNGLKIR
jgi:hypothetical protein